MMKHRREILVGILSVAVLIVETNAGANTLSAKQYGMIAERNIFDLQQPHEIKVVPTPSPIAKITLNGITTILGDKCVLLKVQMPSKPGGFANAQSLILTEGQSAGQIQILQVDEKAGKVTLNNFGTVMLLSFEGDGPIDGK